MLYLVAIGGAAAIAVAAVLLRMRLTARRQREEVRIIRTSDLYAHLYPVLLDCRKGYIQSVSVGPEQTVVRLYHPARREAVFRYAEQGFDPPDRRQRLALAQAIAVDLPALRDREQYVFEKTEERSADGDGTAWRYTVRSEARDRVMRSLRA